MHSCIYEGTVVHSRRSPVSHRFSRRLFMVYLDLEELPQLTAKRGLISTRRFASRSLLASDHLAGRDEPLANQIRAKIEQESGIRPTGPVRLLTQLRYCGIYFSPLNLFFVFDQQDHLEWIVAEVSNTPWNERHTYVLNNTIGQNSEEALRFRHPKEFHVSPFMGMDMEYRWRLSPPGERLDVGLTNYENSQSKFSARLSLQRRQMSRKLLRRMMLRYPLMTAQIPIAIYLQAFRLWWKRCPYYPHPKTEGSSAATQISSDLTSKQSSRQYLS